MFFDNWVCVGYGFIEFEDEKFAEYRAVNLLFYKIFNWAIDKNYKIYDFGTFTVNEEPNMGLGRFKENFGASGIFRDTIELVV